MRSVRVIVRGRVQGVGFRWFVRESANAHAVTGWARNLRDGDVEAELHGTIGAVESVIDTMRTGPASARVDEIIVSAADPVAPAGFEIRSTA
ncbi:acylphosphatase [Microbacterium paludicola]|uniref:acylphosphatase n=1 Tax=Microbacterium paludicola TaxID=300019 RepID=UPI00119FCBD0|nr:acylphosphatase [Microbacterium paludicola]